MPRSPSRSVSPRPRSPSLSPPRPDSRSPRGRSLTPDDMPAYKRKRYADFIPSVILANRIAGPHLPIHEIVLHPHLLVDDALSPRIIMLTDQKLTGPMSRILILTADVLERMLFWKNKSTWLWRTMVMRMGRSQQTKNRQMTLLGQNLQSFLGQGVVERTSLPQS